MNENFVAKLCGKTLANEHLMIGMLMFQYKLLHCAL